MLWSTQGSVTLNEQKKVYASQNLQSFCIQAKQAALAKPCSSCCVEGWSECQLEMKERWRRLQNPRLDEAGTALWADCLWGWSSYAVFLFWRQAGEKCSHGEPGGEHGWLIKTDEVWASWLLVGHFNACKWLVQSGATWPAAPVLHTVKKKKKLGKLTNLRQPALVHKVNICVN